MSLQTESRSRNPTGDRDPAANPDEKVHNRHLEQSVVQYLSNRDDPVRIGTVARNIAAAESGTPVTALSSKQYRQVYTALYQTHLPYLDRAGMLAYDRVRGLVYPSGSREQITIADELASASDASLTASAPAPEPTASSSKRLVAIGLVGLVLSGAVIPLSLTAGVMIGSLVIVVWFTCMITNI